MTYTKNRAIEVGEAEQIVANIGNFGPADLPAGGARWTLNISPNVAVTSVAFTGGSFSYTISTTAAGATTIRIINTALIPEATSYNALINVVGRIVSPEQVTTLNAVVTNDGLALGVGNLSTANDNQSTTKAVVAQGALPVTLVAFSGKYTEGTGNVLNWATANEKNNAFFQIERSSDARQFESIATIKGNGTTTQRNEYAYTDRSALAAVTYYRLKQVDVDGAFSYTRTIAIRRGEGVVALKTFPNPATTELSYEVDAKVQALRIRNVNGISMLDQKMGNEMTNRVDISSLSAGTYVLEVHTAEGQVLRQRFIKQ